VKVRQFEVMLEFNGINAIIKLIAEKITEKF